MSILILGIVLFIIGTYMMGLYVQTADDMGITFLKYFAISAASVGLLLGGLFLMTTFFVTEHHQDIIDKAGIELDLRKVEELGK